MHDLSKHDFQTRWGGKGVEYNASITVCECFFMIKQLLDALTNSKKIDSTLLKIHPYNMEPLG